MLIQIDSMMLRQMLRCSVCKKFRHSLKLCGTCFAVICKYEYDQSFGSWVNRQHLPSTKAMNCPVCKSRKSKLAEPTAIKQLIQRAVLPGANTFCRAVSSQDNIITHDQMVDLVRHEAQTVAKCTKILIDECVQDQPCWTSPSGEDLYDIVLSLINLCNPAVHLDALSNGVIEWLSIQIKSTNPVIELYGLAALASISESGTKNRLMLTDFKQIKASLQFISMVELYKL